MVPTCELTYDVAEPIAAACSNDISASAFTIPLDSLGDLVSNSENAIERFKRSASDIFCAFLPIHATTLENLNSKLNETNPLILIDQPVQCIQEGSSLLLREVTRLEQSLERVSGIANRRNIDFDGSPVAVAILGRPDGIAEVLPGVLVDETTISKARQASECLLTDSPISELGRCQQELHSIHDRINRALDEIEGYARQLGLPFDSTQNAVTYLVTLGQIASQAPSDLLDHRRPSLAHPRTTELLALAEEAYASEKSQREALKKEVYLDVLPAIDDLKAALRALRRSDSLFNFLNSDWRAAKKLVRGISKLKVKKKAAEYEALVSDIIRWVEHRASFVTNDDFKDVFGQLFKGIKTDFSKIRRLHSWYVNSQDEMLKHPGLIESVDLSALDSRSISQLAALSSRLQAISSELETCGEKARQLLMPVSNQLHSTLKHAGWADFNQKILQIGGEIKNAALFLSRCVKPETSPKRALEVLIAKLELRGAHEDLETLNNGQETIRDYVEPLLPGVASIPCVRWGEYLAVLKGLARANSGLGEMLAPLGEKGSMPRNLRIFIEAKLALDETLEKFAPLPERSATSKWHAYIAVASRRISSAAKLFELLKPAGECGKTAREVVVGLNSRKQAAALMQGLTEDVHVTAMLQGLFHGIETDLESLASTLSWGEAVIRVEQVGHSSIKALLINSEATGNFHWVKQQLEKITEIHEGIQKKLSELREFGTFDWNIWNITDAARTKANFASGLLERIGTAARNIEPVLPWSKYNAERLDCEKTGLGDFVHSVEQQKLPPESVGSVFEFVAYRSIGRGIVASHIIPAKAL